MKRIIYIFLSIILSLVLLLGIYVLIIYIKDTYSIKNDPTLYKGFKIIEEENISAEDGRNFYTMQVDTNNPKPPYRLYVFTSETREDHLCFVDSYKGKFKPKVDFVMSVDDEDYYVIEEYIINYDNGEFSTLSARSLDMVNESESEFEEYVPIVKKLIEQKSWRWIYEGAEFLLKSKEKEYMMDVLKNFKSENGDKVEYSEPYYRSTLTFEKMNDKCNELLQKYGGKQ